MKIQIALASTAHWIMPSEDDLRLEYRYEYNLPQRNWKGRCKTIGANFPLFADEEDFIAKVKASPIVDLTQTMHVHNLTSLRSVEDVRDLVSGYAFPRDVDRIVTGLKKGVALPAPIIVKGKLGMWILSGNTRQNLASIANIPRQAIMVDAS